MLLSGDLHSSCSKVAQVPSTPVAAAKALGEFQSHCRRRQHSSNTPTKPSPSSPAIPVCSNHLKSSASRLYLLLLRTCAPGCAPAKPARYWAAVEGQEGCSGALWLPPNWFQNKIAAPTNHHHPPPSIHIAGPQTEFSFCTFFAQLALGSRRLWCLSCSTERGATRKMGLKKKSCSCWSKQSNPHTLQFWAWVPWCWSLKQFKDGWILEGKKGFTFRFFLATLNIFIKPWVNSTTGRTHPDSWRSL